MLFFSTPNQLAMQCIHKKRIVDVSFLSLISPLREGLYWLCKDRQWEDGRICSPHPGQIVSRPLWNLCSCHNSNKVCVGQLDKPHIFSVYLSCVKFRELAYQIADQFRVFGRHIGLKDTVIVGGIGEVQNHLGMPPTSLFPTLVFRPFCTSLV